MPAHKTITLLAGLLLAQQAAAVAPHSQQHAQHGRPLKAQAAVFHEQLHAEAEQAGDKQSVRTIEAGRAESNPLVLPAALDDGADDEGKEKQCMTVCGSWGEECMLINRGAGGMTRKCRRACQRFVEECF